MAPSVPNYKQQAVPGQIPGVQAPNVSAQSFGAGFGTKLQDVGSKIQYDDDKLAAYRVARQARIDADDMWTGESGGRWKKGAEYLGWAGKTAHPFVESMPSRLEGLTPGARTLAEPLLDDVRDQFDARVRLSAGDATVDMVNGQFAADKQSISDSARLGATDPNEGLASLDRGLEEGGYRIFEFAQDHPEQITGLPKDQWIGEEVKVYESTLVRNAINDALAAGQTDLARVYKEKHGDKLLPDDRRAVEQSVGKASSLQEVADTFTFLQTGMPLLVGDDAAEQAKAAGQFYRPPAAQIESWLKDIRAIGKAKGWPQEQIEDAVSYTQKRASDELQLLRAKQDELVASLGNELAGNGGDLLALQQQRPGDFRYIEDKGRTLLAKDAAAMAGARSDGEEIGSYLGFVRMSEQDPQAFKKVSEYEIRASVSDAHATTLMQIRKAAGAGSGIQSPLRILTQHMARMGYTNSSGVPNRKGVAFTQDVEAMWSAEGGADKLDNVELQKRLDNISATREISGWWNDKPAFVMTIDDVKWDDIPQDVINEIGAAVAPELPINSSDLMKQDAIRARYLAALRAGLYPP